MISETEPICKGSCRSVQGFNIGKLIYDAVKEGILVSGGGHKMAGGFSIDQKNINLFKNFVNNKFPNNGIEIKKNYECEILLSQLCFELLDNQDSLSPFGQGNPTPKFLIKDCYINFMKVVGDGHLVCTIEDFYGNKFKSISFGAVQNGLFQYVQDFGSSGVDVIVKIKKKVWKDEMFIELQIEDVVLSR